MSEQSPNHSTAKTNTSETSNPSTKFQKLQELPTQIQQQLKAVKTSAQNTYHQVVNKATETVDHLDTWAVDRVNENIDKVAETVDRSRLEAQTKLQKGIKETQSTIQQKAKDTGNWFKNISKWKS